MPFTLLSSRTYRHMPWKNGGGITTEIAVADLPGGDAGQFLWRASIAYVTESCAYSDFAGYERFTTILEGKGLQLAVDGVSVTLLRRDPVFEFPGEAAVHGTLIDGPTRNFNLMVNRERANGRLELVAGGAAVQIPGTGAALVHALDGNVAVRTAEGEVQIPRGWTGRLDGLAGTVEPDQDAAALLALVNVLGEA
ncbi:HutD family protein [Azospirillum sp. SYSU D00513]|uniref:HutD/Ves family protein n=1 Tax=Azospirillum sp. SYSU D00513 TaxID=2812561 RepID=UPI0024954695|nr:HutD family protein [Azospirillum sp. SYSU D00513]